MTDERFLRKVKYGIITAILIIAQLYMLNQANVAMDSISLSFYEFVVTVLWLALAYFGIRFLIILFMDKNRFLEAIDILLIRLNNGILKLFDVMTRNRNNSYHREYNDNNYRGNNYIYNNNYNNISNGTARSNRYNDSRKVDDDPLSRANRNFYDVNRNFDRTMRKVDRDFDRVNRNMDRTMRDIDRGFDSFFGSKKKSRK